MKLVTTLKHMVRTLLNRTRPRDTSSEQITFEGGSGESPEKAVIIRGAFHDLMGTVAEFHWLAAAFGQKDVDWKVVTHAHGTVGNKDIDTVVVRLTSGIERTVYFDVTESFGKWPEL